MTRSELAIAIFLAIAALAAIAAWIPTPDEWLEWKFRWRKGR